MKRMKYYTKKMGWMGLLGLLALSATAQDTPPQPDMQAAAELYFSYEPQKALAAYIQLAEQTQQREAFLNAIFIAQEQNERTQATRLAAEAIRLFPQDNEVVETAAEVYLADGQYKRAEQLLSQLPEEPGRQELLYINLARAQLGLHEKELAKSNLKRAAGGKVHTPLSNYLLGLLYEEEKDYAAAVKHLKVAVDYDQQFIEARKHYAYVLEKAGDVNEAYRQYKMVYSSDKTNPAVKEALARLKPKQKPEPPKPTPAQTPVRYLHTLVKPVISLDDKPFPQIKVGLGMRQNGKPPYRTKVRFIPSHPFTATDEKGKVLVRAEAPSTWTAVLEKSGPYLLAPNGKKYPFKKSVLITPQSPSNEEGHTIIVKQLMSGAGMTWASVDDKEFRGQLQIIYHAPLGTLIPVNVLNLEEYLRGVMASEMPPKFPIDALRAQAILARTYALKHRGQFKTYGYDICDNQHCQVYHGVTNESERGNAAVESTAGQTLTYRGRLIESVFSANCGGMTQSAKDAGWYDTPYLHTVSDYKDFSLENLQPYHFRSLLQYYHDAYSRYNKKVSMAAFRWARVVEEKELRNIIKRQKKDIGEIKALIPMRRSRSGYVSQLLVKGTTGTVTLNKENVIRNNLSLGLLRSSYFIVQPSYENGKPKYFVFYGGGWGHGVGFDQTGAAGRAEAGQDYKTILQHYFPKAEVTEDNK